MSVGAFAAGHVAGRFAALRALNVSLDDFTDALLEEEARVTLDSLREGFSVYFVQAFLVLAVFFAVKLVGWLIGLLFAKAIERMYTRHRSRGDVNALVQTYFSIVFFLLAVSTALGSIGIDFSNIVLSLGILGGLVLTGIGGHLQEIFYGISLQSSGIFADVDRVMVGKYECKIERYHLICVELQILKENGTSAVTERRIVVANSSFVHQPIEFCRHDTASTSAAQYSFAGSNYAYGEAAARHRTHTSHATGKEMHLDLSDVVGLAR